MTVPVSRAFNRQQFAVLPARPLLDRLDVDDDLRAGQGSLHRPLDPDGLAVRPGHVGVARHQLVEIDEAVGAGLPRPQGVVG